MKCECCQLNFLLCQSSRLFQTNWRLSSKKPDIVKNVILSQCSDVMIHTLYHRHSTNTKPFETRKNQMKWLMENVYSVSIRNNIQEGNWIQENVYTYRSLRQQTFLLCIDFEQYRKIKRVELLPSLKKWAKIIQGFIKKIIYGDHEESLGELVSCEICMADKKIGEIIGFQCCPEKHQACVSCVKEMRKAKSFKCHLCREEIHELHVHKGVKMYLEFSNIKIVQRAVN